MARHENGQTHRVWLPEAVRQIIGESKAPKASFSQGTALSTAMRGICRTLGVNDKVTPHDLRRTHGSTITRLGFGRDAINRIENHREGGIADVYDQYEYAEENKRVMEAVAVRLLALATGTAPAGNVVQLKA